MTAYLLIIFTTLTSVVLLLLVPQEKFFNSQKRGISRFTWRTWFVIFLNILTLILSLRKQNIDNIEIKQKQEQINRLEKNDSLVKKQLDNFGFQFDFNSQKLLKKIDSSLIYKSYSTSILNKVIQKPQIDICRRGIQVKFFDDTTISFNIPYCALTDENAYNVNLSSIIIYNNPVDYRILNSVPDVFPRNIVLTNEMGKAIEFKLSPINLNRIDSIYLFVIGSYTNIDNTSTFLVKDIFKKSQITTEWVRLMGKEDSDIRKFLRVKRLL